MAQQSMAATYDIATEDAVYHLGLRHTFSGLAQSTLDVFTEILDDLNIVSRELGDSGVSQKLVLKLKNTMSDRHAAEKLFSQLLQEYRKDVLPDFVSGRRCHWIRTSWLFCTFLYLL